MKRNKKTIETIIEQLENDANKAWTKNVNENPSIYENMSKYPFLYGYVIQGIKSHFKNKSV